MVRVGISLIPDHRHLAAAYPLFANGVVGALEWGIDFAWLQRRPSLEFVALLDEFGAAGRLYAHGLQYSPCSAGQEQYHQQWLAMLQRDLVDRPYRHLTEHFGLVQVDGLSNRAPMPLPLDATLLNTTQTNLRRLLDVFERPIGIENLALALNADDARRQAEFLAKVVAPLGGFLLLDLHNVYCQACNFDCSFDMLVESVPLELVREVHLSGGSWQQLSGPHRRPLRCDTHDGRVPPEILEMLARLVTRASELEVVILEQLPEGLETAEERSGFVEDFMNVKSIIDGI